MDEAVLPEVDVVALEEEVVVDSEVIVVDVEVVEVCAGSSIVDYRSSSLIEDHVLIKFLRVYRRR